MDTTTAKNAHNAADRRLVEYFLIISTMEKNQKKKNHKATNKNSNGSNNNGDMTFSDWRTESSGMIDTDPNSNRNNNNNNNNNKNSNDNSSNIHDYYNNNIALQPKITARYPLIDHYDHPLQDENVIFFCHPSGSISVRTQPHMPKVRIVYGASRMEMI